MRFLLSLFLLQNSLSVSAFVSNSAIGRTPAFRSVTSLYDAPAPLAEEGTWQAFLDEETTGLIYYFDLKTGDSLWEPPTETFPQVRLNRTQKRAADDLRKKYRQSRQQEVEAPAEIKAEQKEQKEQQAEVPNWIVDLIATPQQKQEEEASAPAPAEQQQKPDWFSGMFGDNTATEEKEEQEEPVLTNGETIVKKKIPSMLDSFMKKSEATQPAKAAVETKPAVKKVKPVVKKEEKIVDLTPKPIKIEMGSFVLPHPAKVQWGGEDAVYTKGRSFGCFDGVSGAEKLDGVPLYSRTLAEEMKRMTNSDGLTVQDMTKFLTEAAEYADNCATGASTAVVASIGENGFLQALNVGDSCCMVIRGGRITAKTREISHYWECPYQLSEDSPDRPKDGTKLNVELISGDLIVMGSDGIFDNIDDDMLLDLIGKSPTKPAQLARKICDLSRKQSLDRTSTTPYAKQAQKRGDPDYKEGIGGKVDDSSCIIVLCK